MDDWSHIGREGVSGGPMAYAIMGGLLVATLLTLLLLPALYVAWFRVREPAADERGRATRTAAAI